MSGIKYGCANFFREIERPPRTLLSLFLRFDPLDRSTARKHSWRLGLECVGNRCIGKDISLAPNPQCGSLTENPQFSKKAIFVSSHHLIKNFERENMKNAKISGSGRVVRSFDGSRKQTPLVPPSPLLSSPLAVYQNCAARIRYFRIRTRNLLSPIIFGE